MLSYHIIIPARYASSRLPGKPLMDIAGKTMLQRVYEQALLAQASSVVIATDDTRIQQVAEAFGAQVVMTSANHESGTDRLQEVVSTLQLKPDEIVVNVQGDEPLLPAELITQVATNLANSRAGIATLCEPISQIESVFDPNVVKVVMDKMGYALYFSRASIPFNRATYGDSNPELPTSMGVYRHIGLYAYRVELLHDFVQWGPCELERTEALEQLRAMWNGVKIHVAPAQVTPPQGVDTMADLQRVRALFKVES